MVEVSAQTSTTTVPTAPHGRDTLGRRLLSLVYPKRSAVIAINKWKEEGNTARKYELNRIVRELRKLKRYKHALEVGSSHLLIYSHVLGYDSWIISIMFVFELSSTLCLSIQDWKHLFITGEFVL